MQEAEWMGAAGAREIEVQLKKGELMARKRTSPAEDFVHVIALLPWWGCVVLALGSYIFLHQLAATPPGTLQTGQMGAFVQRSLITAFASVGQFILPGLCLVAALVSFVQRRKRVNLLANVGHARSADALNEMSWAEFEAMVGEAFRMQGYGVTEHGGPQADGGVDLVLRKGNEKFLVQCKQWKAYKVGVDVVRQLYGVMAAQGAAGGFIITSGSFTADAQAFAEGRNVKLVDGPKLFGLIQQVRGTANLRTPLGGGETTAVRTNPAPPLADDPLCPSCQSSMVRRTAKKGVSPGSQFWGCSRYPACRGTR